MGHTHLGALPKSKQWAAVLETLVNGPGSASDDVAKIAAQTLKVTGKGLDRAFEDIGVRRTTYVMAILIIASRRPNRAELLSRLGVHLGADGSVFELTSQIRSSTDLYVEEHGQPTDVSEIAQQAASESILALANERGLQLLDSNADDSGKVFTHLSTPAGSNRVSQLFFGRFIVRYLNFYLSRLTAANIGCSRLPTTASVTEFNAALRDYCDQCADSAGNFAGRLYDTIGSTDEPTQEITSRLASDALSNIRREMEQHGVQL